MTSPYIAIAYFALALGLILSVLWEIFETIVLPRRIDRRFRLTRYYYLAAWSGYTFVCDRIRRTKRRSLFLSIFGPFSLILLFFVWGLALIFGFALMNWSVHSIFKLPGGDALNFGLDLYVSGTTISTLGLGDVAPLSPIARVLTVIEGCLGLGLVALVISYLPALYQAFSRREAEISLLDARAGSPPSAPELLKRTARGGNWRILETLLADWERWCAEIMESHISFPILCFFRSQHTNQNWVSALSAILDTCAFCISCLEHDLSPQSNLTFAIARHAVVDITQVFHRAPCTEMPDRLSRERFNTVCGELQAEGLEVCSEEESWKRLEKMRELYEPYLSALGRHLRMELAPWSHSPEIKDNWLATKWRKSGPISGH